MFYLGPFFGSRSEHRQYAQLFWKCINYPIYLSVVEPGMFYPDVHYCFGTERHSSEVTRDELADITLAMHSAREAFIQCFDIIRMSCSDADLRSVLARSPEFFPEWVWRNQGEMAESVCKEVERGNLIFVPRHEALRACVKAIQEARQERAGPGAPSERFDPYSAAKLMMGKPPRMPRNIEMLSRPVAATSFDDAQLFEYVPDELQGEAVDVAASTNNPGYAAQMLGYDRKTFRKMVHTMKDANDLGGADNVIWHDDGSVYFRDIWIDNMYNYAP